MAKKIRFPLPVSILILALLGGGGIGALVNLWVIPAAWPWEMPLLAHRFLAGAAAAYFVGSSIVLRKSTWLAAELLILSVLVYGFPLVGAIGVSANLIDWTKGVAWLFVGIVTPAVIICLSYGWAKREDVQFTHPLNGPTRRFLFALGLLSGLVGVVVFLIPKQAGFIWPWAVLAAWKPLDSRLIASMLLTISSLAFYTHWRNDQDAWDVTAGMLWAYCLVAGLGLVLHAIATPAFLAADVTYLVIFAGISLISWQIHKQKGISK